MKRKKINIKLGKDLGIRVGVFKVAISFVYLLLLTRLIYLQGYKGDYYTKLSKNNRVRVRRIDAPRGKIYDRKGRLLATNIAGYRLVYLNGRSYTEDVIKDISELVDVDEDYIENRIKNGEIYRYTGENMLIDDLPMEKAHKIMEKLSDYPYLDVISYSKRHYIYDTFAAHTLGYVKPITSEEYEDLKEKGYTKRSIIGKKGIEKYYDEILQGKDGYEYIEVNAYNRIVKKINNTKAVPGKDLYLTIDYDLQDYMAKVLDGRKASFIALNAKTGEVLTIVSSPEYSLNKFSSKFTTEEWKKFISDERKPLLNRALTSTYPPGSVFKPVVAMAFLESGIDPEDEIFDPGYYRIGEYTYRSWKWGGHGYSNMTKSLVESVNVYYYAIADKVGHEKIMSTADRFGIGKLTNIDLYEEKPGLLPSDEWKRKKIGERWYRGDTMNLSIGQGGLLTTPLQVAQIYALLANKGKVYTPRLLEKSVDDQGIEEKTEKSVLIDFETSNKNYDVLNNALKETVSAKKGTAKALRTKDVVVAAKTGSAQNSGDNTHAWTAGYFPYDDPEIVFVSFVEGGGGGGRIAAPIAKAFVDKYIELYKVKN
jgi:penicillin-binding protein 2